MLSKFSVLSVRFIFFPYAADSGAETTAVFEIGSAKEAAESPVTGNQNIITHSDFRP